MCVFLNVLYVLHDCEVPNVDSVLFSDCLIAMWLLPSSELIRMPERTGDVSFLLFLNDALHKLLLMSGKLNNTHLNSLVSIVCIHDSASL